MSAANFPQMPDGNPEVSFAVACFNAQPYLSSAIKSALAQTNVSLEVIVVDDGSSDGSLAEARAMAELDPRIRVFQTERNGGPAAARNIALKEMRGKWFAILDSDDLLDKARARLLIDAAETMGADLVADNLLVFGDDVPEHLFFEARVFGTGRWLEIDEYFKRSKLFGRSPGPGVLKPFIRRSVIDRLKLRYNPELRVGEDDELIVRLLHAGCQYFIIPEALYHYRKHAQSISHRLSVGNAEKMLDAEMNIRRLIGMERAGSAAYHQRYSSIENGVAFVRSIEHLAKRRLVAATLAILRKPAAALLYRMPVKSLFQKLFR